ncbi:hybrid sensor histidine kinase/response regulator [Spirochaeta isovalerica]|uniref:histidine kinase n=1 Tax=Spirochaeta isovalerica TaxID=150 RepID=A0A841R9U9_9SPIO|nr:hybrid sensor histidine kinase/response regulator [Spirochaeta isovalerica]MBB6480675.1 signal transduction histidine kinase/CheY-like chemotaxis protein [Spirochaeta isovalerica]
MIFTRHLLEEQERGYLLGLMGFNGPPFIRWSFELGRRLYSRDFPLHLYKTYSEALNEAELLLASSRSDSKISHDNDFSDPDVEKLFYYISAMSWDLDSNTMPSLEIDEQSPYRKIYEALALVKSDFNHILEKQRETEKAIETKVQERTRQLRDQQTKLETSLDLLSHDTKNHFISLKYDADQVEDANLKNSMEESICEIEELISEATGIMSSKKRITSLPEILETIRVTEKRVPLQAHDRIRVEYKSPEFLYVQTTALLKNALSNLIENALKYTGTGNEVRIFCERNKKVQIHIIDFGSGIPDAEKEKILEKFYRRELNEEIEGTGRGLWITNNIIRQEGGTLTISDNPRGGAVFSISLPPYQVEDFQGMLKELSEWFESPLDSIRSRAETYRTLYQLQGREDVEDLDSAVFTSLLSEIRKERKEEKQAHMARKLDHLKNRNPEGKSIIIADDSLYVQYYLSRYFTELGLNVIDYVDNGESAVISYRKRKPDYISLDNNMNVMTGPEAAEQIYAYDKDCRVIFITALGDSSLFREALKEKLASCRYRILTKPIYKKDIEVLLDEF